MSELQQVAEFVLLAWLLMAFVALCGLAAMIIAVSSGSYGGMKKRKKQKILGSFLQKRAKRRRV